MYTTPVHKLVNYGYIVFFFASAAFNAASMSMQTLIVAGILAGFGVTLVGFSFLREDLYKKAQFGLLTVVMFSLIAVNQIYDWEGLMLLGVLCLVALEYGYLKKQVIRKTIIAAALVGLAMTGAVLQGFDVQPHTGDVVWKVANSILFMVTWLYLLFVLVVIPRLRNEQRQRELMAQLEAQSAYYRMAREDHERFLETQEIAEERFFPIDEEGITHAIIAFDGAGKAMGVTFHRSPDRFVALSRDAMVMLIAKMGIIESMGEHIDVRIVDDPPEMSDN